MALGRPQHRLVDIAYRGVLLLCLVAIGCQSEVNQRELGNVIYRLPEVPGAETPYVLQRLESPEKTDNR